MEGDLAKLPEIVELAREYGAVVVVDDSHGVGVLGKTGRGVVEHFGLLGDVDVLTGTLGEGARRRRRRLRRLVGGSLRPACPALAAAALLERASAHRRLSALRAVEVMLEQPELLERLRENTTSFRKMLVEAGYRPLDGEAAIIPIIVGETSAAIALSERLLDEGVFVTGGFPVVPSGTARIRVQMSAALEPEHLERAIEAFVRVKDAI